MNDKFSALAAKVALVAALFLTLASGQTGPAQPEAAKPKMAEEVYKNIEVFKGVPADRLIPAMQFISSSLGVECSYCHVEGAFDKDEKKPKLAARKMAKMMFAINQENFDGHREVTCYSCHRGFPHPVAIPIIADASTIPVPEAIPNTPAQQPSQAPGADQILSKYVEAMGGAPAIGNLSSRVETGTLEGGGRTLPVEIFSKAPDRRMVMMHLPNGDNLTVLDGASGWTAAPGRPTRDMPAAEVASARLEADLQLPLHLQQYFTEVKTGKPEKIGDRDVYVVAGVNSGEVAAKFYFDEHSGVLLRILRYADSPLGSNPTQIDYSDYRDQGRLKMPFQRTIAGPRSRFILRIEQVHDNVPVDDTKFTKPKTPPPAPKPTSPTGL